MVLVDGGTQDSFKSVSKLDFTQIAC